MSNPFATPDMLGARATIPLVEGDVKLSISAVKPFLRKDNDDNPKNWGPRYTLVVKEHSDESIVGSNIPQEFYLHTPDTLGFTKRFLMMALGFENTPAGEKEYNEQYEEDPEAFAFDPTAEPAILGKAYQDAVGNLIEATGNPQLQDDGSKRNNFAWRVVG